MQAVFSGGRLSDVQMLQTPRDRHATRAIPILRQEAVPVEPRETLVERLHALEHQLLPLVVEELLENLEAAA